MSAPGPDPIGIPVRHEREQSKEDLINAYEAEEEKIINVLSRKLEQLREEKIQLENALEAESEAHVNRLSRELSILRSQQQQAQSQSTSTLDSPVAGPSSMPHTPNTGVSFYVPPREPSMEVMLDSLRRENEQLRGRLADVERDYIKVSRLNEIYREELIEHRKRVGASVDSLIGLNDPLDEPVHRRDTPTSPVASSSMTNGGLGRVSVPIPRSSGSTSRPIAGKRTNAPTSNHPNRSTATSASTSSADTGRTTPLSHSFSPGESPPFTFSPMSGHGGNYGSLVSNVTTPSSGGGSQQAVNGVVGQGAGAGLSYPSVPPPSLSSSFGSPNVSYMPSRGESPVASRRSSMSGRRGRVAETGSLRSLSASRRESVERASAATGGTGTGRSRAGSATSDNWTRYTVLGSTIGEDGEAPDEVNGVKMDGLDV